MKKLKFHHVIIFILLFASATFFVLQQLIFHDMHESGFLLFQDMIFMPIHILLVTFILDKILSDREKKERLEHQNIVISSFFSEIGNDVIVMLNTNIVELEKISSVLNMDQTWEDNNFKSAAKIMAAYSYHVNVTQDLLAKLKKQLPQKKEYLLSLFSNPNLLEIDTFTNMLWALYHLTDELENRDDIANLPDTDLEHLAIDIVRIYGMLVCEWIKYMRHLKRKYPYLWSLAVRKNPFAKNKSVIIV
jgi:hypothetical protein